MVSRKGYTNFLILATLIIGFGVFGLMYSLSGQVQSEMRTAVMENEAFLRAQTMDAMLETHMFDQAMNWSFYATMDWTGRDIQDDPKRWDEAHVEGARAVQDYLQARSQEDFRSVYLDDGPLMSDQNLGRLLAPDFQFQIHTLTDRRQVVEHDPPFNVTDGGSDSTEHTPFSDTKRANQWYLPRSNNGDWPHISDELDHEYDRFYIALYREEDTGKESLVFWTYGNDSSGSAQITFEHRPDTARVTLSDDDGELSLDGSQPGGSWGWSEGATDGGVMELPTGWRFLNISIQDSSGSVYFASETEEEFISSDYLTINNTYISEGMNVTMRSTGHISSQFRAGDASVSVHSAPYDNRYVQDTRYFHFYNLTQNLTMNKTFRYLVEGTTMNVSKYLQVEYSDLCDLDSTQSVQHSAGYGDGSNGDGAPYTSGPDCKSAADGFQLQGSEPQGALADAVEEAEKKYAARIGAVLQEKLRNRTEPYYEDPEKWDPIGPNESFEDLDVRLFVRDIDYEIYNLRRPDQYMDRKVADTVESHSDVFYRVTASRTATDSDTSCSCGDDCCGSCTEQCGSKSLTNWYDLSCTFADLDCSTSLSDASITCSGLSGCPSIPSYFPLHEDPPHSVNDGQDEFAGDPVNLEQAHDDCPGIKDQNNVNSDEDCEHDNAAVAQPDGYNRTGDASIGPDAVNYDDEGGTFKKCSNTEQFWNGTHNGWIVNGDSNHPQFGPVNDPPFWQDVRFPDRYFEGDYDGEQVTQEIAYGQARTLPFQQAVRGAETSSGSSTDSCEGPSCGSCTYTPEGTCTIDITETPYIDKAFEDEMVNTTQNFRFDLKARVTVRVSVIDERFNMSGEPGNRAFNFSVAYTQYAKSTFESTPDSEEECVPSGPKDPDEFNRTVVHSR